MKIFFPQVLLEVFWIFISIFLPTTKYQPLGVCKPLLLIAFLNWLQTAKNVLNVGNLVRRNTNCEGIDKTNKWIQSGTLHLNIELSSNQTWFLKVNGFRGRSQFTFTNFHIFLTTHQPLFTIWGHSKTTWTWFCSFLTTHLPPWTLFMH